MWRCTRIHYSLKYLLENLIPIFISNLKTLLALRCLNEAQCFYYFKTGNSCLSFPFCRARVREKGAAENPSAIGTHFQLHYTAILSGCPCSSPGIVLFYTIYLHNMCQSTVPGYFLRDNLILQIGGF